MNYIARTSINVNKALSEAIMETATTPDQSDKLSWERCRHIQILVEGINRAALRVLDVTAAMERDRKHGGST